MRQQLLLLPMIAVMLCACAGAPQARPTPVAPAPPTVPAAPATPATPAPPVTPAPAAPLTDLTVQPPPDQPAGPPPSAVLPAPATVDPSAALGRFLDAVQSGNAPQAWDLLSQESRREMGGTVDAFITHALPGLRERFASLKGYRPVLNQQVSPKVSVVAITSDRSGTTVDVAATAFTSEAGLWKVSLTQFPITPLSRPGRRLIGYRTAETNVTADQLWLDGAPLPVTRSGSDVTAPLPASLPAGRHVAVALAVDANGVPTAYAWLYVPGPQ